MREEHSIDGLKPEKVAVIPEKRSPRTIEAAFYETDGTVKNEDSFIFIGQKLTHIPDGISELLNPRHKRQLRFKLPIESFFSIENKPFNPHEVFGH